MIGLKELLDLAEKYGDDFRFVRALSCDVMEIQLLAGNPVKVVDQTLIGVTPSENNYIALGLEEKTFRRSAHIIPNGILEVHDGRWKGGIPAWEGVDMAEKVKGDREYDWALVGSERDGEVQHYLYCFYCGKWVHIRHQSTWEDFQDFHPHWWLDTLESKDCLHSFVRWGTKGFDDKTMVLERCEFCDEERERPAEIDEREKLSKWLDRSMHHMNDGFLKAMDIEDGPRSVEEYGIDAMEKAEAFAEEHPRNVQIVGVDDSAFANADLVLINHCDDKEFMGTAVYYIPQCQGTGAEFFLYPGHRRALIEALQLIERQNAAYDDEEAF